MRELHQQEKIIIHSEADLKYHLYRFGDYLAKREGYNEHTGIDAVHFYIIQKYNWLPSQVFSMNSSDIRFLLAEEMSGWTLPKDAVL
ncbi:MAG: hypothetical protein GY737_26745 [Desulfobacteraceae bacterium]|nr:hypothetical protein [Desulfobacteraceae bacterium]